MSRPSTPPRPADWSLSIQDLMDALQSKQRSFVFFRLQELDSDFELTATGHRESPGTGE